MQPIHLAGIDYAILIAYVAFVIGIGWTLARYMKTSADFLTSARSIPTWVTGLAFISANLGALELVGMAASGAKYGISTAHFYWVGAIPAMIFLAVFMMPFYYGSKARSVPEYLKMRFDERVRALNSIAFAVMTIFASGISMNALAKLLNQLLGWDYNIALWICSAVVLVYVLKGGLTSAIYTEVLQFFMIVLGFAPVVYLGLKDVGGWHAMNHSLQAVAVNPSVIYLKDAGTTYASDAWTSAWRPVLAGPASNPMGVDWFAMIFGLGFVLSFGYWCTNFLVVQRAMAAKNMTAARNTPLVAAVPKMFFPFLVIVPGMIAAALCTLPDKGYRIPPPIISQASYDNAIGAVKNANAPDADAVKAQHRDQDGKSRIHLVHLVGRGHDRSGLPRRSRGLFMVDQRGAPCRSRHSTRASKAPAYQPLERHFVPTHHGLAARAISSDRLPADRIERDRHSPGTM